MNSKKREWSWLNPDCNLVCPIDGVPITPTSEIQILGVPLGSQEFTESFVKRDLLDVAEGVMSKLIDFEDTQAAIFLLRLSFGIVRATHFMRTTPLSLWSKQAGEFDEKVSQTVFQLMPKLLSPPPLVLFGDRKEPRESSREPQTRYWFKPALARARQEEASVTGFHASMEFGKMPIQTGLTE